MSNRRMAVTARCLIVIVSCSMILGARAAAAQCTAERGTEAVRTLQGPYASAAGPDREQVVRRTSRTTGAEEIVTEIYSHSIEGGRLVLTARIRCLTTTTSDGSHTVEETEELNPAAPSEPLRVVRRSVTTVRTTGPGSFVSERQVFELDVNGRFVPVLADRTRLP
jgi:hypothetical protein